MHGMMLSMVHRQRQRSDLCRCFRSSTIFLPYLALAQLLLLQVVLVHLPTMCNANIAPELIVLMENRNFCLSVPTSPTAGDVVTLSRCDNNAKGQYFLYDNRGQWRTNEDPNLCVVVNRRIAQAGDALQLARCTGNQQQDWFFNDDGDKELQTRNSQAVCATYSGSTPSAGSRAQMERCNRGLSQAWDFKYDNPDRPGGDWELLRMRRNTNTCAAVDRGDVSSGSGVKAVRCNSRDRAQHWRFQDDRTWRPRDNTDLCVEIDSVRARQDLNLRSCDRSEYRRWYYNENDLFEITPRQDDSLCVARDSFDFLRVYPCRDLSRGDREWEFIEVD